MIAQRHRFHGRNALKSVYQRGVSVRGPLLGLKYMQRPGRPYRAAVVVSRKVHKSAVARNRIRRRVYEACRQVDPELTDGKDLVFTAYHEKLATIDAPELSRAVHGLLQKANRPPARPTTPTGHAIVKPVNPKGSH